jgi:Cu+-exporting ATPase
LFWLAVAAVEQPSGTRGGPRRAAAAWRRWPTPSTSGQAGAGVEAAWPGPGSVGTGAWLAAAGVAVADLEPTAAALAARGRTPSFVAIDGALAGVVAVADRPTAEARQAIAALRAMGLEVAMVDADRCVTATAVAAGSHHRCSPRCA